MTFHMLIEHLFRLFFVVFLIRILYLLYINPMYILYTNPMSIKILKHHIHTCNLFFLPFKIITFNIYDNLKISEDERSEAKVTLNIYINLRNDVLQHFISQS